MPYIIEKLNRLGGIELSRMQDIGGLRIVVPTIDDIKKVHDRLLRKTSTRGCGQNPGHLNEVIYGIYSPTNYCSIKTV